MNVSLEQSLRESHKDRKYSGIHTHRFSDLRKARVFASYDDVKSLLGNPHKKTEIIAYKNRNSGEIVGCLILKKTKVTPQFKDRIGMNHLKERLLSYRINLDSSQQMNSGVQAYLFDALKAVAGEFRFSVKFVPSTGYDFDTTRGITYLKEEGNNSEHEEKSLEQRIFPMLAIGSIVASLSFLSSNLTGNAIADLSLSISNWIGGVLFLVGVCAAFTYFRRR